MGIKLLLMCQTIYVYLDFLPLHEYRPIHEAATPPVRAPLVLKAIRHYSRLTELELVV
jgi:hypothetical protein